MAIACYLAMTAAEFAVCGQPPTPIGWLACHFSPSGAGLSNIPRTLPANSLLILDDSNPYSGHDPQHALHQLKQAVSELEVRAIILDFQRQLDPELQTLVTLLQDELPCPVVAPVAYAHVSCPVFVPPCPLDRPLEQHLAPYRGRQIWLDATPLPARITITAEGYAYQTLPFGDSINAIHRDASLCCNYDIEISPEQIVFTLNRDESAFLSWLSQAEDLGVASVIGLYQEFKQ